MPAKLTRRQFFKVCAAGMGTSSLGVLGFAPTAAPSSRSRSIFCRMR